MAERKDTAREVSRRSFLKKFGLLLTGFEVFAGAKETSGRELAVEKNALEKPRLRGEAMFYKRFANNEVECRLCFHTCRIKVGQRGSCRNKENRKGTLFNVVYGRPSAVAVDPVEKEPQHHFLPGSNMLSIGTAGCNFRCRHCHNWHLSQRSIEDMEWYDLSPEKAVATALARNTSIISFTYNDPIAFFEYAYDVARLAREKNLKILWHSNGSMKPEPLQDFLKFTDAVTIDLKGFSEEVYRKVSSAKLQPVLETLKTIKRKGVWLEIVNLVIPTLNDNLGMIKDMCVWIKENLGSDVPLHFSRFFPAYKLKNLALTPIDTLEKAYKVSREAGLQYVTIGNVPGHEYNSTFCPKCGEKIIHRSHFEVEDNHVVDGKCKFCNHQIPGIWK